MDTDVQNNFRVIKKKTGKVIKFPCKKGLCVREEEPPANCCVNSTEIKIWTQRKIERAKAAIKFYHDMNAESLKNMKVFI